jgi:enoyl-CoA hydratase/3-hydroxyacyl-CoA dehydrogenase
VIEAVPEKLDLKQRVFVEAEAAAAPRALLATNTSAMRIREIGSGLPDPARLVGMHFFNPVLLMDLVEIIPSPAARPEALATAEAVAAKLGKTAVTLRADTPGFVTSRLISVWVGAAVLAQEAKIADKESIDAAMRFRAGFPMGPFELADYTGLDVGLHASDYMADRLGEAYRPGASMRALVEKGDLGKKTGRGFYAWKDGKAQVRLDAEQAKAFDPTLVLALVANEAAKLVEQGVATAADVDLACRQGLAFPKGPLEWADEVGVDAVVKALYTLQERTGHPLAEPYELLLEMVEEGRTGKQAGRGFHDYAPAQGKRERETLVVTVDAASRVGTITLDRPHRLHAINADLIREMEDAIRELDRDERVRVILVTGSGEKAFCAGADLSEATGVTPSAATETIRRAHRMCIEIEKCAKPVVAAVNGLALGGGFELALACDLRVAARGATFGLPEVTLGLLPAMGGTQRLPKLVGLARAKEIALLGKRFDAQQALAWGLVTAVYDNDRFKLEAHAFAAELATRAPLALKATKQLLNASATTDIHAGMELEAMAFGVLVSTDDVLEGVSAMFAKRKPEFQGK